MARFAPVWRAGEPLRLTYQTRGHVGALRLLIGGEAFPAELTDRSAQIVVGPELFGHFPDRVAVSLQARTPYGWESIATGFLVKEARNG